MPFNKFLEYKSNHKSFKLSPLRTKKYGAQSKPTQINPLLSLMKQSDNNGLHIILCTLFGALSF